MCGVNGIFAFQGAANPPRREELLTTRDAMAARGPDGDGEWWSLDGRCGLAHRRLKILDLSDRANQPMLTEDGRFAIVFNGEIYNYPELRTELQAHGVRLRTTSDTEALLHLYALFGAEMLDKLRGMYAFAVWDRDRGGVFLARDPYGIKPLYVSNDGWTFRFASQVKALLAGGGVSREPEPAGVVGFHLFGSVPEPFTIYRDIRALPAGSWQWVDKAGAREPRQFASIAAVLSRARREVPSEDVDVSIVRNAVSESVKAHLLSDVEVGLFLSSGVDSGALLGLMRDAGQASIQVITLTYDELEGTREDEAPVARVVAAHYGAKHKIRRVDAAEFASDLPAIMAAMDQPSIDGVNTWFVAKAAKEAGLKVALSGVGGDELFAGYPSFLDIPKWVAWLRPTALGGIGRALRQAGQVVAPGVKRRQPKLLGLLEFGGSYPAAYLLKRGLFLPFELRDQLDSDLVADGLRRLKPLRRLEATMSPDPGSSIARVSALESANYLRNQLLRDADWAGMAHSVEIRTPLVDFRLLQQIAPIVPRLAGKTGKLALAHAPSRPLPDEVVDRPKTGFNVPVQRWMLLGPRGRAASKGVASRAWALDVWRRHGAKPVSAA